MIRLDSVNKSYGARVVLESVTWAIPPKSRVGLVGRNGSGKTTLLRLIAGLEETDSGTVEVSRGMSVGYLAQEGARRAEGTVMEALLSTFPEVAHLEQQLHDVHEKMARTSGRKQAELTRQAGDIQHRYEAAGGYRLEAEARIILTGLGFAPSDHDRPLAEMSGGYRMRAVLGSLLLRHPDYLLLDEPTNHLDLEAVTWLESFLADTDSALIMVSHDRTFLNKLAKGIAELSHAKLTVYPGNYDEYRVAREAARDRQRAAAAQEAHRIGEVERFIERFRYKASKARQVQSRIKMLDKMKRTQVAPEEKTWRFLLPPAPRSAARVLRLEGISKSFGSRRVLGGEGRGLDFQLMRGDRVAVIGPNGCGKSTLLKVAGGLLRPDAGTVEVGEKVVIHYFAQHVLETLTPGRTALEEMQAWAPAKTPGELRSLLGIFQFSGEEVFKPVEVLSGGEKNRLALARLMLDPGNFLLLDEPTNHLDLPAREALEDALSRYDGTLLFVSHDRYFINRVATRVAGFADGDLLARDGDYDVFMAWREAAAAPPPGEPEPKRQSPGPARRTREQKREEARARNERAARLRACRDRIASLEKAIIEAEHRVDEIDAELADPSTYQAEGRARELGERKKALQVELSRLNRKWDDAAGQLERLEGEG